MLLKITSIDSRGFGIAKDSKGNKYKILGALPNEVVSVRIIKQNKKNIYAVIDKVIEASKFRVEPKDIDSYLSSSVWQILDFKQENIYKSEIVKSEFNKFIKIDKFEVVSQDEQDSWNYRNKAEMQFCLHDEKLSYAFYSQGESWQKIPVQNSSIFSEVINAESKKILYFLNKSGISVDKLRYIILRSFNNRSLSKIARILRQAPVFAKATPGRQDERPLMVSEVEPYERVVALLCLEKDAIKSIETEAEAQKLISENLKSIIFAIPKADSYEIITKIGDSELKEKVLEKSFYFDFDHFFQINIPMFERAISDIKQLLDDKKLEDSTLVDLFAGVGVIGLLLADKFKKVIGVEISSGTKEFALKNAQINNITNYEFYESDINNALELVQKADILVVDPPRGGLTPQLIDSIKKYLPKYIIYLSCNHETFVNDLSLLHDNYEIKFLRGYNFFPHTPHIECLAFLQRRW